MVQTDINTLGGLDRCDSSGAIVATTHGGCPRERGAEASSGCGCATGGCGQRPGPACRKHGSEPATGRRYHLFAGRLAAIRLASTLGRRLDPVGRCGEAIRTEARAIGSARPSGPAMLLPQPREAAPAPAPGLPPVSHALFPAHPQSTPLESQIASFVTNPPPRAVPVAASTTQPQADSTVQVGEPRQRALIPASSLPLKINESVENRGIFEWPEGMRAKPVEETPVPQSPIAKRTRAIFRSPQIPRSADEEQQVAAQPAPAQTPEQAPRLRAVQSKAGSRESRAPQSVSPAPAWLRLRSRQPTCLARALCARTAADSCCLERAQSASDGPSSAGSFGHAASGDAVVSPSPQLAQPQPQAAHRNNLSRVPCSPSRLMTGQRSWLSPSRSSGRMCCRPTVGAQGQAAQPIAGQPAARRVARRRRLYSPSRCLCERSRRPGPAGPAQEIPAEKLSGWGDIGRSPPTRAAECTATDVRLQPWRPHRGARLTRDRCFPLNFSDNRLIWPRPPLHRQIAKRLPLPAKRRP